MPTGPGIPQVVYPIISTGRVLYSLVPRSFWVHRANIPEVMLEIILSLCIKEVIATELRYAQKYQVFVLCMCMSMCVSLRRMTQSSLPKSSINVLSQCIYPFFTTSISCCFFNPSASLHHIPSLREERLYYYDLSELHTRKLSCKKAQL